MYLYLYDAYLLDKAYQHQLARVETRLTDLGIGGKISRLSPLKNLRELIRDEVAGGVRTIVAVGNDGTFITVVNEVIRHDEVTVGHIPLGPKTDIARALGIPPAEAAADVVAARRLMRLDVGKANHTYFLTGLTLPASRVTLELDEAYQVSPSDGPYAVHICNLKPAAWAGATDHRRFNPSDGRLEALIQPAARRGAFWRRRGRDGPPSILPCRRVKILGGKSVTVITDGERVLKTPVAVEVVPAKLRMIVGKERIF